MAQPQQTETAPSVKDLLERIAALEAQVEELQKRRGSGDVSALGMRT